MKGYLPFHKILIMSSSKSLSRIPKKPSNIPIVDYSGLPPSIKKRFERLQESIRNSIRRLSDRITSNVNDFSTLYKENDVLALRVTELEHENLEIKRTLDALCTFIFPDGITIPSSSHNVSDGLPNSIDDFSFGDLQEMLDEDPQPPIDDVNTDVQVDSTDFLDLFSLPEFQLPNSSENISSINIPSDDPLDF